MTPQHFWHPDLSGTLQGAGGVGGLVAVSIDGDYYCPGYDNNGNVIGYWNEDGELVAEYAYDAFGNTIAATGSMSAVFPHRFSTKYCDADTDLYYYGYRYYSPSLGRWISRDPIGEKGGNNLFAFCYNSNATYDSLGTIVIEDPHKRWPAESYRKLKEELESRFEETIATIKEPFKSAIRTQWPNMHFIIAKPDQDVCKNSVRGMTTEKGQCLRDIVNHKVIHADGSFSVFTLPKRWTNRAYLCGCNIGKDLSEWANVAVHETAHNVGWGGYYVDENNPELNNPQKNGELQIHPNVEYWGIPGRSYD